jgi:hypothetical protein
MFATDLMSAGLGQAAVRLRHLSVVRPDKVTSFSIPALVIAATQLGPRVLEAPDAVHLEIALDELLGEPKLCSLLRVVTEELGDFEQSVETRIPQIVDILSVEQAQKLADLAPLYDLWFELRSRLISLVGITKVVESIPAGESTFLDRLYDSSVPPQVSLIHLDALRGEVAVLGLLCAARRKTPPPSWMADELLRYMTKGVYESVRLLASIPELAVSESEFPVAERLPLADILERSHKAAVGAEVLLMLADVTGEPLTPWNQLPDTEP